MQRFKKIKSQEFLVSFDPKAKVYEIFKSEYIGSGDNRDDISAVISEYLVSDSLKFSNAETKMILAALENLNETNKANGFSEEAEAAETLRFKILSALIDEIMS